MSTTEYVSQRTLRGEEHSTLQSLVQELQRLEETKKDYVVDTRRMSFTTTHEGDTSQTRSLLTFDVNSEDGTDGGALNEHAHRQLRTRLDIPAKYYDRMRQDAPPLLDANVMHWFHHKPERRMVRMLEGRVRAFLSNRYRMLDNLDLMQQAVLPELARHEGDLVFHISALTDERLYIRALLPGLQAEVRPGLGDIVQAGVQIRNSEVGSGKLEVAPFIWRLACLNGMVANDHALGRYHVGREQEDTAYAIYRDDTLAADDAAFFLKVRDAVGAALSDTQFELIVGQLREAATGERIADPVAATERLQKAHTLTDDEGGSILRYLAEGGDLSQWGAANAVTAAAKEAESFERQVELETLGGALVGLPEQEWARIAAR